MALPASSLAMPPSTATLTSSELYTQTLAAEADVLRAAQAWPVLVGHLTDMTNPPARQQLAIIARGMYREQVIFMDPFSKSRFKSKSYAAYHLKEGLN